MVRAAFAEKGPLLPKEEGHWRVLSVVGFAIVHCGLSSARDAPRPNIVVRVAADDDGVVPGRPGGGAVVRVAADDDGAVPALFLVKAMQALLHRLGAWVDFQGMLGDLPWDAWHI